MFNLVKGVQLPSYILVEKVKADATIIYEINSTKPTRYDGEVVISYSRNAKTFESSFLILADDMATLEARIDELKLMADIHADQLIVPYAGGYRSYTVHTTQIQLPDRDEWKLPSVVVGVSFMAGDPPYGQNCDINGNLITSHALTLANQTDDTVVGAANFGGTADPNPTAQLTFDLVGDMTAFDLINEKTGQQISISTSGGANGDVYQIGNQSVKRNGLEMDFTGVFPNYKNGANNVEVDVYSSTGTILEASQTAVTSKRLFYGTKKEAQSFTFSTADLMNRLTLMLSKVGNPTGNVTVRIETDSAGSPSGTLVSTAATFDITPSQIQSLPVWIKSSLSFIQMATSTTYWIVVSAATGTDSSNYYQWHYNTSNSYANGSPKEYTGSWGALTGDFAFKAFKVVTDLNNSTPNNGSQALNLAATTQRDGANTALWETGGPDITMNGVTGQPITQTNQPNAVSGFGATFNGWTAYTALAQKIVPGSNMLMKSIDAVMRAYTNRGAINGHFYFEVQTDNAGNPSGTVLATSQSVASNSLWDYNSTVFGNVPFTNAVSLTSGTTYWLVLKTNDIFGDNADTMAAWAGQPTSTLSASNARVYSAGGWGVQDRGTTPSSWFGDFAFKVNTISYSTVENAITTELDNTGLDIIAVSQFLQTILLGSSVISPFFSVDNGTTWDALVRDASLFDSDTYPSITGHQLKWKGALSSPTSTKPFITGLTLGWKKGTILDSTTKYGAQRWTPQSTGNRQRIDLYIAKTGTPGNLTIEVRNDNAGKPGSTVLATQTVAASAVSTGLGWVPVNFASAFSLTSGTVYHIVAYAAGVSSVNRYLIRANDTTVNNGQINHSINSGGAWTTVSTGTENWLIKTYSVTGAAFRYTLDMLYVKPYP